MINRGRLELATSPIGSNIIIGDAKFNFLIFRHYHYILMIIIGLTFSLFNDELPYILPKGKLVYVTVTF